MFICDIEGTCSMCEICNINLEDIYKVSKQKFHSNLLNEEVSYFCNKPKAFIYNSVNNSKTFIKELKRLGFKKVYSYMGNTKIGNTYKRVDTYMIKKGKFN